ncbi:U2 small nuclear ribonucleoprotein B'' [Fistulifera solaris]|uniref:U2 small nuclear ribonucleoprotein B n=1 Tax=Fistulifera solaris TaxID=1519565 RepID=A0A1Z5JFE9_FISSO|nr:U2 small nuclear ribonucleoprotein B'' [Fistulifera solaris]|eukprot:GAX12656.1 U2 small nuclear ribonucleoprotein B'' [Fistulifera solaris]
MLQPNPTLYLKNIDWKIKKPFLRRALYSLFTRHGKVHEVIVLRREGLRGQAWIIFDDVQAAVAALQAEQGFTLFGKDLVIEFAKAPSDRISRRDGTYVPKAKRAKTDDKRADENEGTTAATAVPAATPLPEAPPSKYLLADNLPQECNEMMLGMLFRQYAGFKEVRMPRPGLAFVEFEDEPHATLAKNGLNGFQITANDRLNLNYGKN